MREKEGDKLMAVFNLTGDEQAFSLNGNSYAGSYTNVFTAADVSLNADHELTLGAWEYVLLETRAEEN